MSDLWRYRLLGEEFGPAPRATVAELLRSGDLGGADEVCPDGGVWGPAADFPELAAAVDDASPQLDDGLARLLEQFETPKAPAPALSPAPSIASASGAFGRATQIELALSPADEACPVWHLEPESAPRGPYDWNALLAEATAGRVTPRTRLREGDDGPWVRAATLPGLFAELTEARSVSGLAEQTARLHETPHPEIEPGASASADGSSSVAAALPRSESSARESSTREPSTPERSAPPQDEWSQFFQAAEERERRKRRRAESTHTPASRSSPTSPPPESGSTPPLPTAAASSVPAQPVPVAINAGAATPTAGGASGSAAIPPAAATPPGFGVTAAATPARGPVPAGKSRAVRSISLPTLNLRGLWEKLRDLSGIDARSAAAAAGLTIVAAVIYLPSLFQGTPGAEYFPPIQQAWQQVLQKHERKAPAEEWSQLAGELEALLAESQQKLAPVVASQGIKSPLAQRLLWMVDTENGPTKARGFLRRAIEGQGKVDAAVIRSGTSVMSEAAALAPRK